MSGADRRELAAIAQRFTRHRDADVRRQASQLLQALAAIEGPTTAPAIDWSLPVKTADQCELCEDCGEPWCEECGMHYADCKHPGPQSERPN